jgi:DNA-binding Lrp family transcriptional regulator
VVTEISKMSKMVERRNYMIHRANRYRSYREIAAMVGMSHERVGQIIKAGAKEV